MSRESFLFSLKVVSFTHCLCFVLLFSQEPKQHMSVNPPLSHEGLLARVPIALDVTVGSSVILMQMSLILLTNPHTVVTTNLSILEECNHNSPFTNKESQGLIYYCVFKA